MSFLLGDLPERFHYWFAINGLLPGAVECGCPGVDEVYDAARSCSRQFVTGDALDRGRAPVRSDVREDLRSIRQQMTEQHAQSIQRIIFCCYDKRLPDAVPVKRRIQDRFKEVAVRVVIRPLPLALKSTGNGVVAKRLFTESGLIQIWIADHQVPC